MKKAITSILLVVFIAANALAQTGHTGNIKLAEKYLPAQGNPQKALKYIHSQRTYTRGGSSWFSYVNAVNNYLGNINPSLSYTYLFPDSNITADFGGGTYGTPFIHSIATVLDPKSILFQPPYANPGSPQFTANNSYTLDSVEFFYGYFRNYPDVNEVDTLVLTVFDNSTSEGNGGNFSTAYFSGASVLTAFGVDTVRFAVVPYNYLNNSPLPNVTGAIQVKIPLDKNYGNDTITGGQSVAKISTSALGTIDANSLVAVSASFIPGYSYSHSDTLNNMNYVVISSLNEIPGSYPVYNGDFNQSYVAMNDNQYDSSMGFNNLYVPTVAFLPAYTFDDHEFSFLLNCPTCADSNVVTGNCTASFSSSVNGNIASFSSSGSTNAVTYAWDFGDGSSDSTSANPIHTYASPGIYNVCLSITNGVNCSNSNCNYLAVGTQSSQHCSVYYNLFPSNTPHLWYLVYEANGDAPITYNWSWGDGTTSVGDTVSHSYSGPGSYKICLTITDDTLCTSTYCDSSTYIFRMEGGTSPITTKAINLSDVATAVKPVSATAQSLGVVPNPCFNCEVRGVENVSDLLITDLLGRAVQVSYSKSSGGYQLNIPPDRTGFFIVRNIRTGEVVKFVRE